MMWLLVFAILAAVLPGLYMYSVTLVQGGRFPILRNKRICLLIAHPDDEAMFFAPTLLALTRPETGNHVKILCLSTGNADGLGETRKKELVKSGMLLGIREEHDVFVLDKPDFPDSMTTTWDKHKISSLLCEAFAPHLAANKPPAIDVIITFDAHGISSHPNHISLYHGARTFVSALAERTNTGTVALYTLTTVPLLRKYTGFIDMFVTLLINWLGGGGASSTSQGEGKPPTNLLFANQLANVKGSTGGLPTAWSAMTTAHRSQMVWFRYGWIALSRYMVLNDLQLEDV